MAPVLAHKPGVDRAFERLYRRHAVDVYRYAFAVLRNQADAEDVAQTTFMNAYRALERGEVPETPHNWLIRIAHNVCRQRFRQASRRPLEVGFEDDVADRFVEPEDDNVPTPDDIRRAMRHLAFNQRAALVMRELEGRSYAEIADLLDLSVSAVETLIFRARRALREQLEGALTCGQAELAISRQLDSALPRSERAELRAHLRECAACRKIARSQRAQRSALRGAFGAVPLPSGLASLFGGGGASVGAAVAAKAAVVVAAAGVATGVGLDVHHRLVRPPAHHRTVPAHATASQHPAARVSAPPATAAPAAVVVVPPGQAVHRAARGTARAEHRAHAATHLSPAPPPAVTTVAEDTPSAAETARAPETPATASHGRGNGNGNANGNGNGNGNGHRNDASTSQGEAKGNGNVHGRGHQKSNAPISDASMPTQTSPSPGDQSHGHRPDQGTGDPSTKAKGHGGEPAPPLVPPVTTTPVVTVPEPPVPVPDGGGDGH